MSKKRNKPKAKVRKTLGNKLALTQRQSTLLQQGALAQSKGDLAFAEKAYRALVAEKVPVPHPYCNLAQICNQSERFEEARRLWKTALSIDAASVQARMGLAAHYELLGNSEQAIKACQQVLAREPDYIPARYLMANQFKARGEFAEAMALYQEIMARQPDYTQAHFTYSGIHKYRSASDPHIDTMRGLLESGRLSTEQRVQLAFALSKAFEDLQDYPQAFRFLERGNSLRRDSFHYSIDSDADLISNIMHTFNREDISRLRVDANPSKRPIFIVGMVRSGTSLVEKILSSHTDVYGAGELQYIFRLAGELFLKESLRYQFAPLGAYPTGTFEQFGKAYLEKVDLLDRGSPHVTDKMPFNMMMIGLIKIALPNAKIIHCVRDARDTCLSIFRQNFTTGNYRFAYDLTSLGKYHNLYRQLMQHWHAVFPGAIYDINYESLTQNPEHEIGQLLNACDLEWQDACLDFHKSPGVVKTASYFQVRQPMYTSSVNLWQKYEEFLQPLLDALDE